MYLSVYYIILDTFFLIIISAVFIAIISVLIGLNDIINLAEKALINVRDDNDKKFDEKEIPKSALNKVRKQIKHEIEMKDSQFIYEQKQKEKEEEEKRKKLKDGDEFLKVTASEQVIQILTDSINLSAIEVEQLSKQISSEQLDTINLVKLKRAQRSMRYTLAFLCFAFLVTGYDLLDYIINSNFDTKSSLNASPYPTQFSYIAHILFDFTADLLLILSVYKRSDCCTKIAANSFMYICCPILDCDGKSEEYLNNVNKTIDINGNPLKTPIDVDKIDIYADTNDVNGNEEETQMQSKTTTTTLIPNQPPFSQHTSVTASTQLGLPTTTMSRIGSLNEDGILVVIYNLENALLSVRKNLNPISYDGYDENDTDEEEEMIAIESLTFEQASKAFGGKDGITLLKVHFDYLMAMDVKLFVISRKSSQIVTTVLNKCGLLKYFNSDDTIISDRVIGRDHQLFWTKTNHQYSLNEKLLKIIEKCACVNDSILYIDSDGITVNVERINLCRVYGVKNAGLTIDDFKAIQKKYFSPI